MILKFFLFTILIFNITNASITSLFKDFTASLKEDKQNGDGKKECCDENQLMLQLAKLYIISPERIILQLTCSTVTEMCKELKLVLNKLNQQFQTCVPLPKENLYMKLLAGAHVLHEKVCESEDACLREFMVYWYKFSKHNTIVLLDVGKSQDCLRLLRSDYMDCEGPADWYEKTNETVVCKCYVDILNCNYVKTGELCGLELAHYMRHLTIDVFRPIIPKKCKTPRCLPKISDPMPNEGGINVIHLFLYICNFGLFLFLM